MTLQHKTTFMTVDEVADLLKISANTVRRWISDNEMPAYKVGRGWRIAARDLSHWLVAHRAGCGGVEAA